MSSAVFPRPQWAGGPGGASGGWCVLHHGLEGNVPNRRAVVHRHRDAVDLERGRATAPAYAPITAAAGNHRSSTVTTALPSARNVSSAAATSPPPRVSSRPVAPGFSSSV